MYSHFYVNDHFSYLGLTSKPIQNFFLSSLFIDIPPRICVHSKMIKQKAKWWCFRIFLFVFPLSIPLSSSASKEGGIKREKKSVRYPQMIDNSCTDIHLGKHRSQQRTVQFFFSFFMRVWGGGQRKRGVPHSRAYILLIRGYNKTINIQNYLLSLFEVMNEQLNKMGRC